MMNKWWARLVPAAAVTPAPQVAFAIIGPKASVAGSVSFFVKEWSLTLLRARKTAGLETGRSKRYFWGTGKME